MTRGTAFLRIASLATAVAIVFAFVASSGSLSSDRVRDAIDPLGVAAVPAFVVVSALLTCALFPGPLPAGASRRCRSGSSGAASGRCCTRGSRRACRTRSSTTPPA